MSWHGFWPAENKKIFLTEARSWTILNISSVKIVPIAGNRTGKGQKYVFEYTVRRDQKRQHLE